MNINCLVGIQCPKCGSESSFNIEGTAMFEVSDDFNIEGTAMFEVSDDGTSDYHNVEWNDDSIIRCNDCGYTGTVGVFKHGLTPEEAVAACWRVLYVDENTGEEIPDKHWDADILDHLADIIRCAYRNVKIPQREPDAPPPAAQA